MSNCIKNCFLFSIITTMLLLTACGGESTSNTSPKAQEAQTQKTPTVNKEPSKAETSDNKVAEKKTENVAVNWVGIDELEELSKKEQRKVMVDLYTDWCGWCKRMDQATFQHPEIAEYLNEHFYAVKFNAELKEKLSFKGKEYEYVKPGRRGHNELAFNFASGRMSYPTIAFLDENLERINSFPGFKQPQQFDPLLHYIKEDHYKSKTLAKFQKSFKSKIGGNFAPAKSQKPVIKVN